MVTITDIYRYICKIPMPKTTFTRIYVDDLKAMKERFQGKSSAEILKVIINERVS